MSASLLAGKRCLIFGASSKYSIGLHVAKAWREAGASSITIACESEELSRKVADIAAAEGWWSTDVCRTLKCDVRLDEDIQMATEAEQDVILHSVAKAPTSAMKAGSILRLSRQDLLSTIDVSANSLLAIAQRANFGSKGGSMISLTFDSSNRVVPGYGAMAPAKAVLETLTRYIAHELGSKNIRMNCISPGPLKTPASRAIPNFAAMADGAAKRSFFGRGVRVEEVASLATFLASDYASGISGEIIHVDCGEHLVSG
jgi:enoyl-[acyl-carrier protein] reductase I